MFSEDRSIGRADFDYAFDEFQPVSVKLLKDEKKEKSSSNLRWSNVGGLEKLKEELIETIQWRFEVGRNGFSVKQIRKVFLRFQHSKYFSAAPIRLVSGILLYGPSGCGKTLVAQVLASECRVNLIQVKVSRMRKRIFVIRSRDTSVHIELFLSTRKRVEIRCGMCFV